MIDNIINIKDFKQVIAEKRLPYANLRKCIETKTIDKFGVYSEFTIYLTIPGPNNEIIQCRVAYKIFSQFVKDKDTKENKEYQTWIKKAEDLIRKHFDFEIIDGRWQDRICDIRRNRL